MYGPFRPRRVKSPAARTSVWMRAALNVTTSISLKHSRPRRDADGTTRLDYSDVKITTLPPAKRGTVQKQKPPIRSEKANG